VREALQAHADERAIDRREVVRALAPPRAEAGRASERGDLAQREREVDRVVLRDAPDERRPLGARERLERAPAREHATAPGTEDSGRDAQHGRLARAVAPDERRQR